MFCWRLEHMGAAGAGLLVAYEAFADAEAWVPAGVRSSYVSMPGGPGQLQRQTSLCYKPLPILIKHKDAQATCLLGHALTMIVSRIHLRMQPSPLADLNACLHAVFQGIDIFFCPTGSVATVEAAWTPVIVGDLSRPQLRLRDVAQKDVFDDTSLSLVECLPAG